MTVRAVAFRLVEAIENCEIAVDDGRVWIVERAAGHGSSVSGDSPEVSTQPCEQSSLGAAGPRAHRSRSASGPGRTSRVVTRAAVSTRKDPANTSIIAEATRLSTCVTTRGDVGERRLSGLVIADTGRPAGREAIAGRMRATCRKQLRRSGFRAGNAVPRRRCTPAEIETERGVVTHTDRRARPSGTPEAGSIAGLGLGGRHDGDPVCWIAPTSGGVDSLASRGFSWTRPAPAAASPGPPPEFGGRAEV